MHSMSKKLISALLVLFMVLNLIAGFPVMAEETAGGTAEAISENEPAAEEIFENDAAPAVYVDEEPAAVPEESAAMVIAVLNKTRMMGRRINARLYSEQ